MKIVDVKGDGSCFYRSLYESANNRPRMVERMLKKMGHIVSTTKPTQTQFVQHFRLGLSKRIVDQKDYGVIKDVYTNLKAMDSKNYKEIMTSSFPSWIVREFKQLPKTEASFRKAFAQGVLSMSAWASEIEVRIVNEILKKELKSRLGVFNSPPRSSFQFKKNVLYLINRDELHYNAIVIEDKDLKEKRTDCSEDQIRNPDSNRCVSRSSCKGWEVRARASEKKR